MDDQLNVTWCGICHQTLNNPRMLPCIHTFCSQCLEDSIKNIPPNGDGMCPVCQQVFTVPANGINGIKLNVFARKLVDMSELKDQLAQSSANLFCEHCLEENTESGCQPRQATYYCCQCKQKFCSLCIRYHAIVGDLKDHTVVELGKSVEESLIKGSVVKCDNHVKETVRVYCNQCSEFLCLVCLTELHDDHDYQLLTYVDVENRDLLKDDEDVLKESQADLCAKKEGLESEIKRIDDSAAEIDMAITRRANEIKNLVDKCAQELKIELRKMSRTAVTEFTCRLEENKKLQLKYDHTIKYSAELRKRCPPIELFDMIEVMHTRSNELQRLNAAHDEKPLPKFQALFEMSQLDKFLETNSNIVGRVLGPEKGRVVGKSEGAEKRTDGAAGTSDSTLHEEQS